MRKLIAMLGALLLSSIVYAGSVAHQATCPDGLRDLEKQYWAMILNDPKIAELQVIDQRVDCAVVVPPLSEDDFKKMAMITEMFTLYPDVAAPWTKMPNGNIYIIRGMRSDRIEFMKIIYAPKNGNLLLSRITIGLKEK